MKLRVFTAFSGYDDIVDGEEWRDIKGFEGCYQVSSWGRVRSLPRQRRGRGKGFRTTILWRLER